MKPSPFLVVALAIACVALALLSAYERRRADDALTQFDALLRRPATPAPACPEPPRCLCPKPPVFTRAQPPIPPSLVARLARQCRDGLAAHPFPGFTVLMDDNEE